MPQLINQYSYQLIRPLIKKKRYNYKLKKIFIFKYFEKGRKVSKMVI